MRYLCDWFTNAFIELQSNLITLRFFFHVPWDFEIAGVNCIAWSDDRLIEGLMDWLIDCLIHLLFDWSIDLSMTWSTLLQMVTIIDPHIKREGGYHIHEVGGLSKNDLNMQLVMLTSWTKLEQELVFFFSHPTPLLQEASSLGYYVKKKEGGEYENWCWPGKMNCGKAISEAMFRPTTALMKNSRHSHAKSDDR